MRKMKIKDILLAIFLLLLFTPVCIAGITGSKHDFSAQGWNTSGEICLPCHTPHHADASVVNAPLWNHEVSSASYTMYSSPTMDAAVPTEPEGISKLCLSCHDGTVALDSFGGDSGSVIISDSAKIGTNLSDDHPISIIWTHQTLGTGPYDCTACHPIFGVDPSTYPLPFYPKDGCLGGTGSCEFTLECSSCHDPHNKLNDPELLRLPLAGSEICLKCHQDK